MDRASERCAYCDRDDVDERWLFLEVERLSPGLEDEYDEVELAFCTQPHAAQFLAERALPWPQVSDADRKGGTWAGLTFLGCGLMAILLSVVGLVAIVRWLA